MAHRQQNTVRPPNHSATTAAWMGHGFGWMDQPGMVQASRSVLGTVTLPQVKEKIDGIIN